jgi:colanic acid biosynthesis protein WcaH
MGSDECWIDEPLYSEIKTKIPLPCVDLLVVYKGQLLLMLRNNAPAKDLWFTPGGRVYKGETLEQAAQRLLKEETGLTPLTFDQKGVMTHIWPQVQTVTVFYVVTVVGQDVTMNDEHRAYKWVKKNSNNLHPYLQEMIQRSQLFTR